MPEQPIKYISLSNSRIAINFETRFYVVLYVSTYTWKHMYLRMPLAYVYFIFLKEWVLMALPKRLLQANLL